MQQIERIEAEGIQLWGLALKRMKVIADVGRQTAWGGGLQDGSVCRRMIQRYKSPVAAKQQGFETL